MLFRKYIYGQVDGVMVKNMVEGVFFGDVEYGIYSGRTRFVTDSSNGYPSSALQK